MITILARNKYYYSTCLKPSESPAFNDCFAGNQIPTNPTKTNNKIIIANG